MKFLNFESVKSAVRDREALGTTLFSFSYWFLTITYFEILLHSIVYGSFSARIGFVVGFSAVAAGLLTLVTSLLPKKAQFPAAMVIGIVLVILFGSQMVYNFIFGTMYSVAQIQQGGDAITSFWRETLSTMGENWVKLLALTVPTVTLALIQKFYSDRQARSNIAYGLFSALFSLAIYGVLMVCLAGGGKGYFTDYYFYHSSDTTTTQVAERFGLITAFRLELSGSGDYDPEDYIEAAKTSPTPTPQAEVETEYNILEIDFDALNEMTEDETILALNEYCASLTGTNKNEYTGMLADYNLIVLCAESFATGAIDPELTPTLYKLANEGIVFNNYYNTWPNNTTDGEYSLVMGLYPDSTRDKVSSSFYASRNSYLPFVLGNAFGEQADIQTYGYHNYTGNYYARNKTHPNLGYQMKFAGDGMTFTTSWPSSDLEMMEQSVDDYIGQDQFHAYYMTFSGHFRYDTALNPMAARNYSQVKNLSYSYASKCYLSCNIELDKALEYLMQRLEEEGIADKTAIVLSGDHFPYGLSNYQYSELVGYTVDDWTKYKSTLIFWVGGLEENIVVDEYCCNVDVLPTILNLWGFEYDSRMLAGTDVFSDAEHIAVLSDKSFFTDKVWFNASTGKVKYLVDESELPAGYLENLIRTVKTKFSISVDILNSAYYNFIFEMGDVQVSRNSWTSWAAFNGVAPAEKEKETETTPEPSESPGGEVTATPEVTITPVPGGEVTPTPEVTVTPTPNAPTETPSTTETPTVTESPVDPTPTPDAPTPTPDAPTPTPAAPTPTPAPPAPTTAPSTGGSESGGSESGSGSTGSSTESVTGGETAEG